jgi:hypothetical protein
MMGDQLQSTNQRPRSWPELTQLQSIRGGARRQQLCDAVRAPTP